ncbi:glutathione S-transferase [Sneathiella marina]|uniref:Glutathione S-transferase n=1 Tax=Sneathiella marina TaxID=2950108 RepID=A0ABY4W4F0_9PROT|nr:glutathione S-transferase [Sneathiella marina]USG60169.1 glutathione S-transferase [Sneathiella marina]
MSDDQIILHHYPQSPVTEKIRTILGFKGLSWQSVIIPRLPPKPNLMPLTGGYRLTPVLQIGADIYCDTSCIIRELENRFPESSLLSATKGELDWAVGNWTDGPLFRDVVTVALVEMSPNMPPEFLADRGPLYFGSDFSLEDIQAKYLDCLANVRTQFSWINNSLKTTEYLSGPMPGLMDAFSYYLVWFLRDRMAEGEAFLSQFDHLVRWEKSIRDIGHGPHEDMSDERALDIAREATPQTASFIDPNDPLNLALGMKVSVEPTGGGPAVSGNLQQLTLDRVSLLRSDPQVDQVCVHFPRLGYKIRAV